MIKNQCFVCGGYNFRADRALSGRLVCTSCGNPYGVRKIVRNKRSNNSSSFIKYKKYIFIFLLMIIFIIFIL